MSLNSVNTNVGAIVALQSLNKTNTELGSVQKRVSTGFRVSDAADDGAAFAVAQGIRGELKAYGAVNERLAQGKGLLEVTSKALENISDTGGDIKALLVKLADENLSANDRTRYNADYVALAADIQRAYQQADFNGRNLVDAGGAAVKIVSDITGGQITLNYTDIDAARTTLGVTAPVDAAAAKTAIGKIDTFLVTVGTALSQIGANRRALDKQDSFIKALSDASTAGLGAIVDADLAKESARLQALQIRQQLGTQSLSIANQAPQILTRLFQG